MHFPDILKFCNRMGIRPVNDVTAQVTADVTAAMDPEGMGVHMGPSAVPLPLGEDAEEVLAAAPPLVPEMATTKEMLGIFVDISKLMGNALVTSSQTVHDSAMNVIVHKVGQMKQYVDEKVAGIDDKMVGVDEKVVQLEKRLALLETPKKSKKPKTKQRSTVSPNISFANGRYSWRKTICKKLGYKGAYKTMHEAKQGLQQFCQEEMQE